MDPSGHVPKAAAADREGVSERRRSERIGLRNPFKDLPVGVEKSDEAMGRRVPLVFNAFGIDPADRLVTTVFKEDGVVKFRQRSTA